MPELTRKQQGWIGERLITEFSYVNPTAHPILFKALANHIERNFAEKLDRCDGFSMNILSRRDQKKYRSDGEYQDVNWNYLKGEPETDEEGFVTNNDELSTWSVDAVVAVDFSEGRALSTFDKLEYPLEIKTGNFDRIQGDQRKAFIHTEVNMETRPYLVNVDISGLPDKYETKVKRYVRSSNQIRKINPENLDEPSEEFQEKLIR